MKLGIPAGEELGPDAVGLATFLDRRGGVRGIRVVRFLVGEARNIVLRNGPNFLHLVFFLEFAEVGEALVEAAVGGRVVRMRRPSSRVLRSPS